MKLGFTFSKRLLIVLVTTITVFCGLNYLSAQQIYRQSANDPQIQISEYTANLLASSGDLASIMPPESADLGKSLSTFIIIYDDNGEPINASAKLNGKIPVLPKGVLDHARKNGQNRVTWEPEKGIRIAAVVTRYNGGYVLAGRSLREVEKRVDMLGRNVAIAWIITILMAFLGNFFLASKNKV